MTKEVDILALGVVPVVNQAVLLLSDKLRQRAIPIWIGQAEANAIGVAMKDINVGRPLTHDLLVVMIEQLDRVVESVEITEVDNEVFHACIRLVSKHGSQEGEILIDARPSDAIALALRVNAPVFVATSVLDECSFSLKFEDGVFVLEDDSVVEEDTDFRDFLRTVKASDFTLNCGES